MITAVLVIFFRCLCSHGIEGSGCGERLYGCNECTYGKWILVFLVVDIGEWGGLGWGGCGWGLLRERGMFEGRMVARGVARNQGRAHFGARRPPSYSDLVRYPKLEVFGNLH